VRSASGQAYIVFEHWQFDRVKAGFECGRNCRPAFPELGVGVSVFVWEEAGEPTPFGPTRSRW